jgi:hypothetical protein
MKRQKMTSTKNPPAQNLWKEQNKKRKQIKSHTSVLHICMYLKYASNDQPENMEKIKFED